MKKELFRFGRGDAAPVLVPKAHARTSFSLALRRFAKNGASVAAAVLIVLLALFALLAPMLSDYDVSFRDGYYRNMPPLFARTQRVTGTQALRDYYAAAGALRSARRISDGYYELKIDAYEQVGFVYVDLSAAEFDALQRWQDENGVQVCYPLPKNYARFYPAVKSSANLWYVLKEDTRFTAGESAHHDETGQSILVADYLTAETDDYHSLRVSDDPGNFVYGAKNQTGYRCRVRYSAYYRYRNGFPARHFFGTNQHGQDIFVCLASGARLSFALSIGVSALNLLIGVLYGALEGYYGGKLDLGMERVADILAAVPFIVIATLFRLHLAQRVGAVASLLFSFVLTGWIGIASRTRLQFYRFKGREYVLCARTLGASDARIVWRHILPNAAGTIITSAVLLIPSVIFSEAMLSYLGIVNLESAELVSLGTMLSGGRAYLGSHPHILIFPAVFISVLEISFHLLGNGLRDAADPTA